jgi:hypothetical protein
MTKKTKRAAAVSALHDRRRRAVEAIEDVVDELDRNPRSLALRADRDRLAGEIDEIDAVLSRRVVASKTREP